MNKPPSNKEIKTIASHLRKPVGVKGIEVANMMNEGNLPMNLHTLAVLNAEPKDHILEIGMANGYFVKHLLNGTRDIKYIGLDYSETMIAEARKLNSKYIEQGTADFIQGDIHQLPFKDEVFDKLFTINTFYFWEDIPEVLNEIKRVLKPNGVFILSIRPKHNMETIPVTKFNFKLLETINIIEILKTAGFDQIEKTEIIEPEQERWGKSFTRETVILKCKIEQ